MHVFRIGRIDEFSIGGDHFYKLDQAAADTVFAQPIMLRQASELASPNLAPHFVQYRLIIYSEQLHKESRPGTSPLQLKAITRRAATKVYLLKALRPPRNTMKMM